MQPGLTSTFALPRQPFELDYFQVLITTCEILVEVYTKIGSYLGPSTSPSATSSLASTGLFPHPPSVAASGLGPRGGTGARAGTGALGLSPSLIETVYKVDGRLKVRPGIHRSALSGSPAARAPCLRIRAKAIDRAPGGEC